MKTTLKDFMRNRYVVLAPEKTAEEAARIMFENKTGCVVVADVGGLTGIVTDRDLACYVLGDQLSGQTTLKQIASAEDLAYVSENSDISTVIAMMKARGIRRVPIVRELVNGVKSCAGLVTLEGLILEHLIELADVREILKSQEQILIKEQSPRYLKRKQARLIQAENIFFKTMAKHMEMRRKHAQPIIMFALKSIVERISRTESYDLISSLPKNIQEELKEASTGPNKQINADYVYGEMKHRFDLTPPAAARRLRSLWIGLEMYLLNNECNHILSQLPRDMQILLTGEPFQYRKLLKLKGRTRVAAATSSDEQTLM